MWQHKLIISKKVEDKVELDPGSNWTEAARLNVDLPGEGDAKWTVMLHAFATVENSEMRFTVDGNPTGWSYGSGTGWDWDVQAVSDIAVVRCLWPGKRDGGPRVQDARQGSRHRQQRGAVSQPSGYL